MVGRGPGLLTPLTLPPASRPPVFRRAPQVPTPEEVPVRADRERAPAVNPSAVLRLYAGVLSVALAVGTAAGPAAAAPPAAPVPSERIAEQVRALDRQVNRVSAALTEGVRRYEQAQDRLARLTYERMAARDDAEALRTDAEASQASFDGLARAAYKGGVPPLVTALLSGDPRAVADLAYVQRSVNTVGFQRRARADDAELRRRTATGRLAQADGDRRSALVLQRAVDAELAELLAEADRLSRELAVTADLLVTARAEEAARARALAEAQARQRAAREAADRAAAARSEALLPWPDAALGSGGTCGAPSTLGEANGFLPASTLCPLSTARGHRLRTDAAAAFDRLAAAYAASTGTPLCVTDSYRSFAAQVDVFARKPSLAAVPGTSQHGWGLAVDLCGGVQTFGSPAHEWMRANAHAFGWHHPRWAQQGGSKPEAWHWEFDPA